jgi:RimJ/RimL family protein N-acetyltransferase
MSLPDHWNIATAKGLVMVRPIGAHEAEAFRELRLEALRENPEGFGGTLEEALALLLQEWANRLQHHLGGPRGIIYVAETNGELIGMMGLSRQEAIKLRHAGQIWGVYLRKSWRGMAISDQLIRACVAWAQHNELRIIRLSVVTSNSSAVRLYARSGFQIYGIEPEALIHDGHYSDELLMARRIERIVEGSANEH